MTTTTSRTPSLKGLLTAQFFGAFNDNAWKFIVITLGLNLLLRSTGTKPDNAQQQEVATLAFVVFTLPMILFSLPAGVLADRLSKRTVIVAMKALEIVLMGGGLFILLSMPDNQIAMLTILGLMGAQSALFSPAKYGIIPEILPHEKLSAGNGQMESWTMLAIIAGTGLGTVLLTEKLSESWIACVPLVLLAVVGFAAALFIPRVPAAATLNTNSPPLGMVQTMQTAWRVMREDRIVWLTVVGMVIYWTLVSLLGQNLIIYTNHITEGFDHKEKLTGIPMAIFGIGVAFGALASGLLSSGKIEYGLIPLGAIAFSFFTFLVSVIQPGFWGTLLLMPFLGAACGLIAIPLNAILQWRAPADRRGAVIALANVFILIGTTVGSVGAYLLATLQVNSAGIFFVGSLIVLAATIWSIYLLPEALLRLIVFLLTHTFYRIKVVGREHLSETGGVLLTPNHVSFIDGLLLMASTDRPIRFVVYEWFANVWYLRPFMRTLRTIPISSSGGPRVILKALRDAGKYLDQGEVVCVFPEGQLTRTGMLLPFRRGIERLVKGREAQIVPVYLDRIWGSVFSHAGGKFFWKIPKEIPYKVQVRFGEPMQADTSVQEVRHAVQELSESAWRDRMTDRPPLHHTLIRSLRKRKRAFAFGEERRPYVSRLRTLSEAIALAKSLQSDWQNQTRVGILLPTSIAAVLVNFAASLSGRTSVNLNYTAAQAELDAAIKQAELQSIVTSKAFLETVNVQLPEGVQPIWIEEVSQRITFGMRFSSWILARWGRKRQIERACGAIHPVNGNEVVTVLFSSGTTGEPKGVQLSHANIDANVEGCAQVVLFERNDRVLGILPLFHSFGYMTTWLSANQGIGVFFAPNPLDTTAIGNFVEKHRLTILITTPTFLDLYLHRISPAQFGSLRLVLTGGEKLSPRLAEAFHNTFGIRPIEGYGTTECSPVVTVSTLDYRGPGEFQSGSRVGSVGHPLPGVAVKLVEPETLQPLDSDEKLQSGMLLVKGPNVMVGYLGQPELTNEVMRDGWYITGDIAQIDEDGFVRITDRHSRFSKIAGEIVPHSRIEEALHEAVEDAQQVFAVTSIFDDVNGECVVVLHTLEEERIADILKKLSESDFPKRFIPKTNQFFKVDQLPLLATGKLDLQALKSIAKERLAVG